MKKLVLANWKMNPGTLAAAEGLVKALVPAVRRSRATVVFCPPAPYLAPLRSKFPKLTFGAQDAFSAAAGPYTGAVAPGMLASAGARYVIVGHSERRANFDETDADVAKKLKAVTAAGLTAVLCIGEPLAVRRKGIAAARRFVAQQAKEDLKNISKNSKVIIAYEPVWAISTSGSGKQETPEGAAAMIDFIKRLLRPTSRAPLPRVIYGGSVNSKNISGFLSQKGIDGFLVGGASLSAKDFGTVIARV